jgi:MSHA pilin protein MshC
MRQVGTRREPALSAQAQTALLLQGARFSESFAPVARSGHVPKGVYRFKSHVDSNQRDAEWLAHAMARRAAQQTPWEDGVAQEATRTQRGFTMIELIMVIVILGVLAVFAAPMFRTDDFTARGFHDETLSLLRYAQKTAIAQRRVVCVTLNPEGVSMSMDKTTPPDGTCDSAPSLPNTPKGGSGLSASVTTFKFTALGSTDQLSNVTITIANAAGITVERDTGYVHD